MNVISTLDSPLALLEGFLHAQLPRRIAPAELIRLRRDPSRGATLIAYVRWGTFRVEAAVDLMGYRLDADAKVQDVEGILDLFERLIGRSIENAVGDFAQRRVDAQLVAIASTFNARVEGLRDDLIRAVGDIAKLRRPWYEKLWSWLTTFYRFDPATGTYNARRRG